MTHDFQQFGNVASVDPDEPVHPPFKLINSKRCSVSSFIFIDIQVNSKLKGSDETVRMRRLV